jgi:hypothetical protein
VSEFKLRKLEIAPVPKSADDKPEWVTIPIGDTGYCVVGPQEATEDLNDPWLVERVRKAPMAHLSISWRGNSAISGFYERWLKEHPLEDEDGYSD